MKTDLFDIKECVNSEELVFAIRTFITEQRQFSVQFNKDGSSVISSPKIGARNVPTPQPTPPVTSAMMRVA